MIPLAHPLLKPADFSNKSAIFHSIMYKFISRLSLLTGLAIAASSMATTASAVTLLGYYVANSANIPSDAGTEAGLANHLLGMVINTTDPTPIPPIPTSGTPYYIRNGNVDPGSGDAGLTGTQGSTGVNSIPAGFEYAFGRYDGPNGGYILWYLGGEAFVAPASSNGGGNWGDTANGLSHYTGFGTGGEVPGVPEGGTTLALLGLALGTLAFVRRKLG